MEVEITGIKCDTSHCNYRCDEVTFDEYPSWIDKPCPICSGNLLTRQDYDKCIRMKKVIRVITALRWINPIFYIRKTYQFISGKKPEYSNLHVKYENDGSVTKEIYKSK